MHCTHVSPSIAGEAYAFVTLGSCSSGVLGGPLALALMSMDGIGGLAGWQWLFLTEGLPAIALGCCYTRLLPTGPRQAWFLSPRQRAWLAARNEAAAAARAKRPGSSAAARAGAGSGGGGTHSALAAVQTAARNWRVWYLAVVVRSMRALVRTLSPSAALARPTCVLPRARPRSTCLGWLRTTASCFGRRCW